MEYTLYNYCIITVTIFRIPVFPDKSPETWTGIFRKVGDLLVPPRYLRKVSTTAQGLGTGRSFPPSDIHSLQTPPPQTNTMFPQKATKLKPQNLGGLAPASKPD